MVRVTCVLVFVDPREVGEEWVFESIEQAEAELGWFYVHNVCEVEQA